MSSKFTVVLVILLIVCAGLCYVSGRVKLSAIDKETNEILDECREWEVRIGDLQKELDAAQEDEYVERVAREKLGLVKPGETLYIVAEPDTTGPEPVVRRRDEPSEIGD